MTRTATARTTAAPPQATDSPLPAVCVEAFGENASWQCRLKTQKLCRSVRRHVLERRHLHDAFRPYGHVGDVIGAAIRLREARQRGRLNVGVIGNSITDRCSWDRDKLPWPERMVQLLRRNGPPLNITRVELRKHAPSGGTITTVFGVLDKLGDPDIVIVDTSMGDQLGYRDNNAVNIWNRAYLSIMALRSLPSRPAVMFSEMIPANTFFDQMWRGPRRVDPCVHDVRTFGHWDALTTLQVPTFAFLPFMCAALPRNESYRHGNFTVYWEPDPTRRGPQHPGCDTHEVIAHAFAQFVLQNLREECVPVSGRTPMSKLAPIGAGLGANMHQQLACLSNTLTHLETGRAPGFEGEAAKARKRPAGRRGGLANVSGAFPALVESGSWVLAEDKRGSPGWIALPNSTGRIAFEVKAKLGRVLVGYLKTHTGVGVARCRAGTGPEVQIDARISGRYSVRDVFTLDAGKEAGEAERRMRVTCRTDGRKFKIMWVKSC